MYIFIYANACARRLGKLPGCEMWTFWQGGPVREGRETLGYPGTPVSYHVYVTIGYSSGCFIIFFMIEQYIWFPVLCEQLPRIN